MKIKNCPVCKGPGLLEKTTGIYSYEPLTVFYNCVNKHAPDLLELTEDQALKLWNKWVDKNTKVYCAECISHRVFEVHHYCTAKARPIESPIYRKGSVIKPLCENINKNNNCKAFKKIKGLKVP